MRALKRLTIDRPPNVLVFQLKRFEYMFHGSKITKKVISCAQLCSGPFLFVSNAMGRKIECQFKKRPHAAQRSHIASHIACKTYSFPSSLTIGEESAIFQAWEQREASCVRYLQMPH